VWRNNKALKSRRDLTPTVSDVGTLKQWNIFYVNAYTTLSLYGFALGKILTLIRAAGGEYDFQNFEEV
jgi:hypothetical protein